MGSVKVRVSSAAEYREKRKHAQELGLSVDEVWWGGAWESDDGEPIFLSGSSNDIEKVGYEYFHVTVSTPNGPQVMKVKPGESTVRDCGYIRLTLSD